MKEVVHFIRNAYSWFNWYEKKIRGMQGIKELIQNKKGVTKFCLISHPLSPSGSDFSIHR
jgi:hypothetical protein